MTFQVSHGGYTRPTPSVAATATEVTFDTPFNYLFPDLVRDPNCLLPAHNSAAVVDHLKALARAMVDNDAPEHGNSTIPPVYTYWGQFIDHDVTANTDRNSAVSDITRADLAPLAPDFVTANLRNLRRPGLDLDSMYGDGPTFGGGSPTQAAALYDGVKLKVGTNAAGKGIPGEVPPPISDLARDLPRTNKMANIGDSRNDENLLVAQLHTAFLRFHNAVVDWVREHEGPYLEMELFNRAQELVRWHYQWLVVHDYLETVTTSGTVDRILLGDLKFYRPGTALFMTLEFSVAAYRFGHSMVRGAYDFNRNFEAAGFDLLFTFTGNGGLRGLNTLPFNWIIESIPSPIWIWGHFCQKFVFKSPIKSIS